MNFSRYITTAFLIIIAFLAISELSVWNSEIFEGNYSSTTIYLQPRQNARDMKEDIEAAASKHAVSVFVVNRNQADAYTTQIDIYGTAQAKGKIQSRSQLKEGTLEGTFLGKHIIKYHDFNKLEDMDSQHEYHLIGSSDDMDKFKEDLINDYAGNFPQDPVYPTNSSHIVILLWVVVFGFAAIMTAFRAASLKKEYAVRRILGEDLFRVAIRNIITDFTVFTCLYFVTKLSISRFADTGYCSKISLLIFGAWLIVNSLIYILFFRFDYKKDLATNKSEKSVLFISYAYKIIVMIIMIVITSLCFALINSGTDLYSQKSFFESKKDCYFVSVRGEDTDIANQKSKDIYGQYNNENKAIQMADIGALSEDANTNILMNSGAKEYLEEVIPELKGKVDRPGIYFITSQDSSSGQEDDMEIMLSQLTDKKVKAKSLQYKKDSKMIVFPAYGEDEYVSEYAENPCIIFNNTGTILQDIFLDQGTMYRMTASEAEELNEEDDLVLTNTYTSYVRNWMKEKKGLIAGLAFLGMILIIEWMINRTIIRYEYRVNATEIILKKITGYSLYGRYKRVLKLTLISFCVAMALAVIAGLLFFKSSMLHIIIGGTLVALVDILLFLKFAISFERINIQKILKGGTL